MTVNREWIGLSLVVVLAVCVIVSGWVIKSYFEAQSFNELTGKNATTWQAMFVELRVQEPMLPQVER